MVLTVESLQAAERGGYAYVLSHAPDDVEWPVLSEMLEDADALTVELPTGWKTARVADLTEDNRADFERTFCGALIRANKARAEAEAQAHGGQWNEQRTSEDAESKAAVERSFAVLPAELPQP